MLELLGLVDKRVQVGISTHGQKDAHGAATVGREQVAFTVDKPKLLKSPSESTLVGIFSQFKALGHDAKMIELRVGKFKRVYRLNGEAPELVSSVSA
ncbi:MAG: hypothetical protein P4L77_10665 [Sulfuriferula sp.]|nr:hypothetical protein [Sulfuriferula sp.]